MPNTSDGTKGSHDVAQRATAAVEGRAVNRLLQSQALFEGLPLELVRITQSTHSAFLEYKSPSKDFNAPLLVKYIMLSSGPQKAAECVSREFKAIETVRRLVGNDLGESIPNPLLVLPDAGLMVTKKLEGIAVSRVLQRDARWIFARFRTGKLREIGHNIGLWLGQFHQATRQPDIPLDAEAFEREVRQQLEGCMRKGLRAASAQGVLRVAAKGSQQAAGRLLPAACRHGDFTVRNLLLDGQQIRVLDFESFAEHDTVYEDLGKFVAYLTLLRGRPGYSRKTLDSFQQSFLEGYGFSIDPQLVGLFTLKAATRMMAHRGTRRISSFLGLDTLYSRQFLRLCANTEMDLNGQGSQPTGGGS
jgi:Sec-independent protein translocase protein TatA